MKHAILITAYKDFEQLKILAASFDDRFDVFIHIDKKSTLSAAIKNEIESLSTVQFLSQEFTVNWGGRNHLKAILLLCENAFNKDDYAYFHLITAQDVPLLSNDALISHFSKLEGKSYLGYFDFPAPFWSNGGVDRMAYYNLYDTLNAKTHRKWIRKLLWLQKKIGLKRSYSNNLPKLYGGSTYWSLHNTAVSKVLSYHQQKPALFHRLKHTFCSEEFYFQTILLASNLASSLIQNNKRCILWQEQHGSSPAILDDRNLELIQTSNALFARKFDWSIPDSKKMFIHLLQQRTHY